MYNSESYDCHLEANMSQNRPKVIIIGAGFGGLFAARRLAREPVDILLVDRNNFHTFTPLLYQVATCGLDPSEIAYPIRSIFRKRPNVRYMLGEVIGIVYDSKYVILKTPNGMRHESYDYLVIACGSVTNYFNDEQLMQNSYSIKDLSDTLNLRNHILTLFERAVWAKDNAERDALLTMVVVGGGATGLETAGALYELYNHVLTNEYRRVEPLTARVILVEALDRLMVNYPERLQKAAYKQLVSLGVEVKLGERVEEVGQSHVKLSSGEIIATHTLVWAAGVKGSPLAELLEVELARGGRVPVKPTLEVIDRDDIYAAGDITYLESSQGGPYPQMIPVAQQQGKIVAENIVHRIAGEPENPFKYFDKGLMATIGRRRAVAYPYNKIQLSGFIAWLTWLTLHLIWLLGFRNRLNVFINWVWNYLTYDRSVRIIIDQAENASSHHTIQPDSAKVKGKL
jgi:NADH dehydrogenase